MIQWEWRGGGIEGKRNLSWGWRGGFCSKVRICHRCHGSAQVLTVSEAGSAAAVCRIRWCAAVETA